MRVVREQDGDGTMGIRAKLVMKRLEWYITLL